MSPRCRALLFTSDIACSLARAKFRKLGLEGIVDKLTVFRGGVPCAQRSSDPPGSRQGAPLKLLFVGADGLRKGLLGVIDACDRLHREGLEIELTIVSAISPSTYVMNGIEIPTQPIRETIERNSWITHFPGLPNREVRALMRTHDVLVLPSLDESLGWVFVEAGMEGRMSIASNAFAMPELVKDRVTGRTVSIELGPNHRWIGLGHPDRREVWEETTRSMAQQLTAMIEELCLNRELVAKWGRAARRHMEELYDPAGAGERLKQIYDRALSRTDS